MSANCNPDVCPDGNCIGCQNGQTWCQDPRCDPYCPNCPIPDDYDFVVNMVMIIIILCLFMAIFIIIFIYGPPMIHPHDDHARANVIVPENI